MADRGIHSSGRLLFGAAFALLVSTAAPIGAAAQNRTNAPGLSRRDDRAPLHMRSTVSPLEAPVREAVASPIDILDVSVDVTPLDARGGLDVSLFLELEVVVDSLRRLALPVRGLDVRGVRVLSPGANDAAPADSTQPAPVRLDFLVVDDSLVVFPGPFSSGQRFTLRIDYAAPEGPAVRSQLTPRGGCCSWTTTVRSGGESWLPIELDPPDRFTAEIRVRPRGALTVLSGGRREATRPAYRFERPVRADQLVLATASTGPEVLMAPGMRIAYFGAAPGGDALRLFHRDLAASLEFVSRVTGYAVDFDTLRVVFGDVGDPGIAGIGILVADPLLLADRSARLTFDPRPAIAELAARLWIDAVLGASSWTDVWVTEALAGWMSIAITASGAGEGEAAAALADRLDAYLEEAGHYRRPLVWDRWDHPSDLLDAHADGKGTGFLHMIHGLVGDGPFRSAIRRIFASASDQGVDTESLRLALEAASGRPLGDLFNTWVYGAGHPVLRVESRFDLTDDRLLIELIQVQEGPMVPGTFPIETDVRWMSLGEDGSAPVVMDESRWTWSSVTGIEPRFVLVDADRRIPAEILDSADLSALTAVVRYGPVPARLSAAHEMARFSDDPALPLAIRLAMEQETQTSVRRELTSLASVIPRGGPLEGLIRRAWADPDARVRAEAVRAAFRFAGDPTWEAFVRDDATRDSAATVLAVAVETLAAMGNADAGFIAESAIITPSYGEVVRKAGFKVLAGDSSMTAFKRRRMLLDHTDESLDPDHILAALLLAESHGADRTLLERLQELLSHPSFRVREGAAIACRWLLTTRDVPLLERRLRIEKDPAVIRALETTVRNLRDG